MNRGRFYGKHFTAKIINPNIIALDKCVCAHAYIVPINTAKKLVKMKWKDVPYDIHWQEMIETFYAPYPMIAFQMDHQSNTSLDLMTNLRSKIGFKNILVICECCSVYKLPLIFLCFIVILIVYFVTTYFK